MKILFSAIGLLAVFTFVSCSNENKKNKDIKQLIIQELGEPDMLNPVNMKDSRADVMSYYLFQKLLSVDPKTNELVPVLAESRPQLTKTPEGGLLITYRLRPEARWDNGSPVTAKDVEFSLKAIKCPGVNNEHARPYFSFIKDFKYDDADPLKFTIVSKEVYMRAEYSSGCDYYIIPAYNYDSKGILSKYKLSDFSDAAKIKEIAADKEIQDFVKEFNSEKFMREASSIKGSGAYDLVEWKTGQQIVFKKKQNWWGDALKSKNTYFDVNMPQIAHKIINDQTTAITALKAGEIDLIYGLKAKDFSEMNESEKVKQGFSKNKSALLSYSFIGLNSKVPALSDKKTRQALAHLLDVDYIINKVYYGYGVKITSTTHPSKKKDYDSTIVPYSYNVEKAKLLLKEDGWEDSNGDGVLDKMIDGKKIDLKLNFIIGAGVDDKKTVALLYKENARKAGVEINIQPLEFGVFMEQLGKHSFDMFYGGWMGEYAPEDYSQLFHTTMINGGGNFTSFGNKETDALIDSIKVELNEEKRSMLYNRFQRIFYEDCQYIFLHSSLNLWVVSNKFDNVYSTGVNPGYWAPGFALKNTKQ